MQKIGGPDQGIALAWAEVLRADARFLDHGAPDVLVELLRVALFPAGHAPADLIVVNDRPFVAAGVIFERTRLLTHVFERDPHPTHEAFGDRREVHAVGVEVLLRPDREIQGLKGPCLAAKEISENL